MYLSSISVSSSVASQLVNITNEVVSLVKESGIQNGICCVYVPHTTAGITINEAADPAVVKDILKELNKIVPFSDGYSHGEGNSAAHIKAALIGSSVTVPVVKGGLQFGTWQGIFFCEFDGPRQRKAHIQVIPGEK